MGERSGRVQAVRRESDGGNVAPTRTRALVGLVVAALVATGLSVAGAPAPAAATDPGALPAAVPAPTPTPAQTGAPNSIAVLGDSISAGTGAQGNIFNAGSEQPENSWATGTAGGLNSLYQRLVAVNSAASGNNYNQSSNGKKMSDAAGQASSLPTSTQYVVIQMGGNDLCRPSEGEMTPVSTYRSQFVNTLNALAARVPDAHIFVASVPDIYNLWYLRGSSFSSSGSAGIARLFWDNGLIDIIPCKSLLENPTSNSAGDDARRNRVRQRTIDLNNVLAEECAKVLRCRFDDFATFNFSSNRVWDGPGQPPNSAPLKPSNEWVFVDGDISTIDHFHPSLAGHRKLAAEAVKASYDWTENTAPEVTTSVDRSAEGSGTLTVNATATDADGVRGMQYRLHPLSGSATGWTSVLGESVSVAVDRLSPAFVEVRALDRNGNFSAGVMQGVFPTPAAPTGPTFTQTVQNGVAGMRVIWRAPSDENQTRGQVAPTIGFEATATPGGQSCRTEAASSDPVDLANIETGCLISGLEFGQTYTFTVRAITQGGPGAAATARLGTLSGPTSAAYIGPSGPVGGVTVTPDGTNLVVRWSPPSDLGGGPLKGYEVTAVRRDSGAEPAVLCGTTQAPGQPPTYFTATQCTLRNPVRLAEYDFEVRAITEISTSPFTTKPTLRSDAAPVSGWLPEVPVLDSNPTAEVSHAERRITVTWPQIPESQRPPGTTVTVTARPGGATCTVPAEVTSCAISGLSPLVPYVLEVVVNNGAGTASGTISARLVAPLDAAEPFTDIASESYIAEPARWLRANGVTTGVGGSDKFNPGGGVTRAEMAAFLWRFAGSPDSPTSCGFTDAAAIPAFARAGACWLKANGITDNNPYNPNGLVTRGQMAAFLWRFAGEPTSTASCGFGDAAKIPEWARAGACWLKANDITLNNPYEPGSPVTRGQMAAFLFRTNGAL